MFVCLFSRREKVSQTLAKLSTADTALAWLLSDHFREVEYLRNFFPVFLVSERDFPLARWFHSVVASGGSEQAFSCVIVSGSHHHRSAEAERIFGLWGRHGVFHVFFLQNRLLWGLQLLLFFLRHVFDSFEFFRRLTA